MSYYFVILFNSITADFGQGSIFQFEKDAKVNTDTVYQCSRVSRFIVCFW